MFTHAVGVAAYDPNRPFGPQFEACSELFHAGCYHGLLQAHMLAVGEMDRAGLNAICADVGNGRQQMWIVFQCVHGLGHGLVGYHNQNLLVALDYCDWLDLDWDRSSCYGGAFMENVTHATQPHLASLLDDSQTGHGGAHDHAHAHGPAPAARPAPAPPFEPLRPDDLHYPCSIVAERYLEQCYLMQTSVILYFNGRDYAAAAITCDGAPPAFRATCHESLGRDATGDMRRDFAQVNRICGLNRSVHAPSCWGGAAKAIVDWAGEPRDGLAFCQSVTAGEPPRLRCYEALGEEMLTVVAEVEKRSQLCVAAGPYFHACARGARLE
jgi:hypothetical protein